MVDPMGRHLDGGQIGRRQFVASCAAGAVLAGRFAHAATAPLKATAIDHISYESKDYKKTRDFYVALFGFQVSEEDDRQLYLWAGTSLLSAKNTPAAAVPSIDHFGVTVDPWDAPAVATALQERGMMGQFIRNDPHDPQGRSAFTRDADGFTLQLDPKDLVTRPAAVVSAAPLRAVALHHISYACPDYAKTRDFYRDFLGARVTNDDGHQADVWFGDIYMAIRTTADGGSRPTVDRVAWTVADWDSQRVSAVLTQHSLEVQAAVDGESILTRDLNGYPLELCSGRKRR
ncbi:MAG TPA: VOC family protein [Vicinamibacterales bacterium]|nr:VOC family protein [Vicinamibacterales bacterium]